MTKARLRKVLARADRPFADDPGRGIMTVGGESAISE